jgi:hypothetical protein
MEGKRRVVGGFEKFGARTQGCVRWKEVGDVED